MKIKGGLFTKYLLMCLKISFLTAFAFLASGCGPSKAQIEASIAASQAESVEQAKRIKTKDAFLVSKEAYEHIKSAYEIIDQYCSDIYNAWKMGIENNKKELTISSLNESLFLTEDDLKIGTILVTYKYAGREDEYANLTNDDKLKMKEASPVLWLSALDIVDQHNLSRFSICVELVQSSYQENGSISRIKNHLEAAKVNMKNLSANYSDYEHYPSLKGLYTTVNSYYEFCDNISGSFEQLKITINDYRKEYRDYKSDLDYIFED